MSNARLISLGGKQILVAERLGGIPVAVRIEEQTLLFFDITTRELLRTRPNPITREQALRLRGVRPAGPPPRPSTEPIRIQRRPPIPGSSWSPGRKSHSGAPIAARKSRSSSPTPPSRSTCPAKMSAPSGAPPPSPSVTSRPTGHGRSPQFPRPNVRHQLAGKRQGPTGTRQSLRQSLRPCVAVLRRRRFPRPKSQKKRADASGCDAGVLPN